MTAPIAPSVVRDAQGTGNAPSWPPVDALRKRLLAWVGVIIFGVVCGGGCTDHEDPRLVVRIDSVSAGMVCLTPHPAMGAEWSSYKGCYPARPAM